MPGSIPSRFDDAPWLCRTGIVVAALGAVVVVGWVASVQMLTILVPNGSPMVMNAALCALGVGAGLVALGAGWRRLAGGLGIAVMLLSLLVFLQFPLGHSLGIDELFWTHQWVTPTRAAGRMAPVAAVGYVLTGLSLAMAAAGRRHHWLPQVIGGVVVSTALVSLLFAVVWLTSGAVRGEYRGMALPTMACLVFSVVALMPPRRGRGLTDAAELQLVAAAVGMLLSVGGAAVQSNAELADANREVQLGFRTRGEIDYLVAEVARMESSARAYCLTGDGSFLSRDGYHRREIQRTLTALAQLTRGDAAQQQRLQEMQRLAEIKFVQIAALEAARQTGSREAAAQYLMDLPRVQTSGLVTVADEIKAAENRKLEDRNAVLAEVEHSTRMVEVVASGLGLALFGAAVVLAQRSRRARTVAEAELQVTNRLLKATLDGTVFSVIATKPEGTIEIFNTGAEKMLGYARDEVVGRVTPALIHLPEEVAARARQLSEELGREIAPGFEVFVARARLGAADEQEWTYVRKDGTRVPVLLSVTALRDSRGEITGFLGVAHDLTARKRAEEGLQVTRTRLEKTFASMSEGLVLQDAQAGILESNAAAERILGLTRDQLMGRTSLDPTWRCVREDGSDFPGTEHPVVVTLRTGRPQRDVVMGVRSVGPKITWIEINTELIGLHGDPARQVVCSFRDVTARREAERAVRAGTEELARQKFALDQHSIVAVTDLNGTILYANDKFCQISQYAREELIGQNHRLINSGHHSKEFFAEMYRTISRGDVWHGEICNRAKDGSLYWEESTIVPFKGPDGRPASYVAIRTDITARKELATNLALARDQALDASRLKSEFLATMSHEIRTPMNAVIGMAGLLSDTSLTPEQAEMARTIVNGAEHLLEIINDILDFSRIEAGRLRLDPVDFDLRRLVEETVTLLASRAHLKGVELTCAIELGPDAMVCGDNGRVRQVLTNLIGNAIKFTDAGEVDIRVRAVAETGNRARVRVTVRDTGVGIPREAQSRLFQPFVQADGSTTRRFGGTGLGLAISRQLVELMGGSIGFESEAGKGSLFWFEVEFVRKGPAAEAPKPTIPSGRRVLVVDDNETNRRILLGQMASWGLEGEAVASGAEALARLRDPRQGSCDVVLVDWHMPEMNGLELAVEIRADPALADTVLVMLSSAGPNVDFGAATAVGFAAFLTKPVTVDQLNRCLSRLLHGVPAAVPVRPTAAGPAATGLRLLLAEDNPANQRVALMLLAKMGHTVEVTANGQLALAQLQCGEFDAVLMDCQMPVLDGYEASRRIRSGLLPGVNPRLPIIALTAYARPEDRARCLEAGMDDYVPKPIRAAELRLALARCGLGDAGAPVPAQDQAGSPAEAAEVFDESALQAAQSLPGVEGPTLLPELIRLYLSDEAERLDHLARLMAEHQAGPLGDEAHSLGGNAASFGGRQVRRIALDLERVARAGDWPAASVQLAQLRQACARLRAEITRRRLLPE